jgi:hypothetical protein
MHLSPHREIAFDRLGKGLQEHNGKADRDQRLDDVAIVDAAGIGGALPDRPGLIDIRNRQPDHDQAERHRDEGRNDVDAMLAAGGEILE